MFSHSPFEFVLLVGMDVRSVFSAFASTFQPF